MYSLTPIMYKDHRRTLQLSDQQATSLRRDLKTFLKHGRAEMKVSVVDTALLNYIKPPGCLRLRGGVGGFPNRMTIIINIPPIGSNQFRNENQQEGDARGLDLGLLKQGTDIFKQGNELLKSAKEEKALIQDAYGTAKEMFHGGIPKLNADTLTLGDHLYDNVIQQRDKMVDIAGNAKQITESLGIDVKGDPREAMEKLKKGYEAYSAVEKFKSQPLNAGNVLATGGAFLKNLGVGSRSAHISDLPLQNGGNAACPPCHSRQTNNQRSYSTSQYQQEGDARGLDLGLFKQGTDIFKQGNELLKLAKEEKALIQDAYGTAHEMFHSGIPKLNADTLTLGDHLYDNVIQQRDKMVDIVGNAKQITESLGIDVKGDPREAMEKLKKGYETYSAVEKLKSQPLNAGNVFATGGAFLKNLGVGSRSAHISDLPLQSGGNATCPPCSSRRDPVGVGSRSANICDLSQEINRIKLLYRQKDGRRFAHIESLLQELELQVYVKMLDCSQMFNTLDANPKMTPEEFSALKAKTVCCKHKLNSVTGHIMDILRNLE